MPKITKKAVSKNPGLTAEMSQTSSRRLYKEASTTLWS